MSRQDRRGAPWPGGAEPDSAHDDALAFCAKLDAVFGPRRRELLARRRRVQEELDAGRLPDVLDETAGIRESEWRIAPVPADIRDRRVEITGTGGPIELPER